MMLAVSFISSFCVRVISRGFEFEHQTASFDLDCWLLLQHNLYIYNTIQNPNVQKQQFGLTALFGVIIDLLFNICRYRVSTTLYKSFVLNYRFQLFITFVCHSRALLCKYRATQRINVYTLFIICYNYVTFQHIGMASILCKQTLELNIIINMIRCYCKKRRSFSNN